MNIVMINNLTRDEMKDLDIQVLKGVVYISLDDRMLYRSEGFFRYELIVTNNREYLQRRGCPKMDNLVFRFVDINNS